MEFVKFLTLVDPDITWVRETVDALRETLAGMSCTCPFDPSVRGATTTRMHEFSRVRQRSRNDKSSGEMEIFSRLLDRLFCARRQPGPGHIYRAGRLSPAGKNRGAVRESEAPIPMHCKS